jgi:hypothetical protein
MRWSCAFAIYSANFKFTLRDACQITQSLRNHIARCTGGANQPPARAQGETMLETIAIILVIFWLLGLVSSYTMGGFIHVLLVVAVVVILIRVIQGRRL